MTFSKIHGTVGLPRGGGGEKWGRVYATGVLKIGGPLTEKWGLLMRTVTEKIMEISEEKLTKQSFLKAGLLGRRLSETAQAK